VNPSARVRHVPDRGGAIDSYAGSEQGLLTKADSFAQAGRIPRHGEESAIPCLKLQAEVDAVAVWELPGRLAPLVVVNNDPRSDQPGRSLVALVVDVDVAHAVDRRADHPPRVRRAASARPHPRPRTTFAPWAPPFQTGARPPDFLRSVRRGRASPPSRLARSATTEHRRCGTVVRPFAEPPHATAADLLVAPPTDRRAQPSWVPCRPARQPRRTRLDGGQWRHAISSRSTRSRSRLSSRASGRTSAKSRGRNISQSKPPWLGAKPAEITVFPAATRASTSGRRWLHGGSPVTR